jgi:hypothetical protein
MQGSDNFSSRPVWWHRLARVSTAGSGSGVGGLLDAELRLVFSAAGSPSELDGAEHLLEQIEVSAAAYKKSRPQF